jgi:hypothetical protein
MTRLRVLVPVLVLCLFAAGCSEPTEEPTRSAGEADENGSAGGGKKGDKEGGKKDRADKDDKKKDGSADGEENVEADGGEGTEEGDDGLTEGSGEDDNSSAVYPAAGNYSYSQNGYEEFCNGPQCDRHALPRSQPVRITHQDAGADAAVIVMEMQSSDNRLTRSTMRFSRAGAVITKVYVRFAYEGFVFEETYTPKPPVEALRFPLETGASWRGSWKDSTSGDYAIRVLEREAVEVGGRTVQAFRVETITDFRGQFNGRSKIETWIDPATKAIVQTDGVLNVNSAFGRYSTSFSTQLASGPGY